MKKHLLLFIVLLNTQFSFAQTSADGSRHINLPAYLIGLKQVAGEDAILHVDSSHGYRVTVPNWWRIKETPVDFFGGIFPAIDGIENALMIKCFKKEEFPGMAAFEGWVVKDYNMGDALQWNPNGKVLLKKVLTDFKDLGSAYKLQWMNGNKLYHSCYIITETASSFIWIDFTATSETYTKNFDRLKEVITSFKKL